MNRSPRSASGVPIVIVDAFAEASFRGNPAGVCVLDRPVSDVWAAAVAREVNLSETAFVLPAGTPGEWLLRWWTPAVEVDLCGHATLAAAHVLAERGDVPTDDRGAATIGFRTRSGLLTARLREGSITLDFPALPPRPADGFDLDALASALGAPPTRTHWNGVDLVVEYDSPRVVAALAPDFAALSKIPCRGVTATAPGDLASPSTSASASETLAGGSTRADFVSRFFAPAAGVPEDPVTGSAHCGLAPLWAGRLGRSRLLGRQISARGGLVGVNLVGDRVELSGRAITFSRGELAIEPDHLPTEDRGTWWIVANASSGNQVSPAGAANRSS